MKEFIALAFVCVSLVSCIAVTTLGERYPAMYEEKPLTIAIMPPINRTTHVEAKDYFYTTLYLPLCEKGYYVYSPYLTMEMFRQESACDAEQFVEATSPLSEMCLELMRQCSPSLRSGEEITSGERLL